MTRRELREHCFKMLFSVDFYTTGEEAKAQMQQYFQSPEEDDTAEDGSLQVVHKVAAGEKDREYLSTRTADVVDKIEEIDAKIDEVAAGWKTKRMGKVELTILRLAVYEMLYDDTIPEKVSVNEAVELAKKFGGNESPAFVNGVLAKFIPKEEKKEEEAGIYLRQERYAGSMRRTFYVGDHMTPNDVQAKYEDGVLTLTLPRKEAPQVEHDGRIAIEG